MYNSLMEICNDRSRFMSLLLHISTFALTSQYFTHTSPKDVAFNGFCSFSENYFLNCFKPKYQAAELLQSKPLVSLSSRQYYQELFITMLGSTPSFSRKRQKGTTDEGHWSCFSELNKSTQLPFTSLLSVEVRLDAPSIPVHTSAERWNKNDCIEVRAEMRWLCKFFQR